MVGKKEKETPEAQSERFRAEVERMIVGGELSPTEAQIAMDRVVRASSDRSTR